MLASMSQIDSRAETPLVDWSDLGVSGLLPTGTVTLLLADVEGSTRLWEIRPEQMTAAFARLDQALSDLLTAPAAEAKAAHDGLREAQSLAMRAAVLAFQGDPGAMRAATEAATEAGGLFAAMGYVALAAAALAAGDAATALGATEAWPHLRARPLTTGVQLLYSAEAALAAGDLVMARRWADEAMSTAGSFYASRVLTTRARIAIAQGEPEQAERDARDALTRAAEIGVHLFTPDIFECLAVVAAELDRHREAARLFGAAAGIRQRMGAARFKVWDAGYDASVAALRNAMSEEDFDSAWAEGAALSTDEAIAYAQRGRGERKRPTSGWASLTPAERDVVRLVSEGLANNDIATRLFVSPRTVQSHLTHVYTKLGLASRVQLVQEAARHV
jgi:DNA-binding CsgD family transcriptional regulator